MKYIRTKDGRIIVPLIEPDVFDSQELESVEIAKVADSIKELCDGFIAELKGNEAEWIAIPIEDFKTLSHDEKLFFAKYWDFYAFIKTSKGFIYVAKMNDKGEFELL